MLTREEVDKAMSKPIVICSGQGKDRRRKILKFVPSEQKYHLYHSSCIQYHLIGDLEDIDELIKLYNER